jgi:hypothetical protein
MTEGRRGIFLDGIDGILSGFTGLVFLGKAGGKFWIMIIMIMRIGGRRVKEGILE